MDQFQQQSPANQNANYPPQVAIPRANLPTDRSFIKIFLLGLITFGIYPLIAYNSITNDVNTICTRYDNKKSMNYVLLVLVITPLTLGIASLVWNHNIANRVGNELRRRGTDGFRSLDILAVVDSRHVYRRRTVYLYVQIRKSDKRTQQSLQRDRNLIQKNQQTAHIGQSVLLLSVNNRLFRNTAVRQLLRFLPLFIIYLTLYNAFSLISSSFKNAYSAE